MKPYNRKLLAHSLPPLQPTTTTPPSPLSVQSLTLVSSPQPDLRILVADTALPLFYFAAFFLLSICACAETAWRRRQRGITGPARTTSDIPPMLDRRKGVDPVRIRALPVDSYCGDAKHQIDCAICLSKFEEKEAVKVIPFCKHVFHPVCIETWLSSHVTCPVCRSTRIFDVVEKGFGRSTVENHDTCIEAVRVVGSFSSGLRRNSSCSSLEDRAVLQRTSSL